MGFTLIELIVVIVILGILAATALPKFVNLSQNAKAAAANALAGSINSEAKLVYASWKVQGGGSLTSVTMDGGTVVVSNLGYPLGSQTGIGSAMNCGSGSDCNGFTVSYGPFLTTFNPEGSTTATCQVTYYPTSGTAFASTKGC